MNRKALIIGVAIAGLVAGAAQAAKAHRHAAATESAGAYAEPAQPIAYSNVDAYLKASPKKRAAQNWSTAAATGSTVNASAQTPMPTAPQPAPAPDTSAQQPAPMAQPSTGPAPATPAPTPGATGGSTTP